MMKEEFEKLVGEEVSSRDYVKIEYVYTWSPLIDNVNGKQQIAMLYKACGMPIINLMLENATKAEKIQQDIANLKRIIEEKKDLLGDLAMGHSTDIGYDVSGLIEGDEDYE